MAFPLFCQYLQVNIIASYVCLKLCELTCLIFENYAKLSTKKKNYITDEIQISDADLKHACSL